jgi:hypothetical protein
MNKPQKIERCLAATNWTGLTLGEMLEAGRVSWEDFDTIRAWCKIALGEPVSYTESKLLSDVVSAIQNGEQSDPLTGAELRAAVAAQAAELLALYSEPLQEVTSFGRGMCEDAPCCGCCGGTDFIPDCEADWTMGGNDDRVEGGWL